MQQSIIFYPVIALVFLTFYVLLLLGYQRVKAVKDKSIDVKFFRTYSGYDSPEKLTLISQNFDNLLALPILLYFACTISYITNNVTLPLVILAWVYVLARYLHSFIHISNNRLKFRFPVFFFGTIVLMVFWIVLSFDLVFRMH